MDLINSLKKEMGTMLGGACEIGSVRHGVIKGMGSESMYVGVHARHYIFYTNNIFIHLLK